MFVCGGYLLGPWLRAGPYAGVKQDFVQECPQYRPARRVAIHYQTYGLVRPATIELFHLAVQSFDDRID
jgi:hypothetical protein